VCSSNDAIFLEKQFQDVEATGSRGIVSTITQTEAAMLTPRSFVLVLTFLFSGIGMSVLAEEKPAGDAALNGTWAMVATEEGEQQMPEAQLAKLNIKLTMKDDTYTTSGAGQTGIGGKLKIDASKTPKEIDIMAESGPQKGTTIPAIYKLDGDKLSVCYDFSGKSRPKEFGTKKGTALFLAVYKKEAAK
jgi:uncharacterized protein (TIGR03067 family)